MIAGLLLLGGVFVVLNLLFGGSRADVRVFEHPRSHQASPGVRYVVRLLTRCAPTVDFDGSYWAPPGRWRLRQPAQPATIELRADDDALLVTKVGQRFHLARVDPPIRLSDCSTASLP